MSFQTAEPPNPGSCSTTSEFDGVDEINWADDMKKTELKSYYQYWGKADPNYPGEPKWHPLVYHCLDVAAVGWL